MAEIITELLSAKKTSVASSAKTTVQVLELVKKSTSLLQNRAKEKQIEIIIGRKDDCKIDIQKQQIWRVLNNLLVNAIKFSPRNSCIFVDVETNGDSITISVKDEGIGIPKQLQKKVFDLSGEAKRVGTDGEETHGMGLFISKQIIEEHGGKIWLSSIDGAGSTFFIKLPCTS